MESGILECVGTVSAVHSTSSHCKLLILRFYLFIFLGGGNRACRGCQNGVFADCYRKGCVFVDGVERGLLTVNRQLPGPSIHVRFNSFHRIDVSDATETSKLTTFPIAIGAGL